LRPVHDHQTGRDRPGPGNYGPDYSRASWPDQGREQSQQGHDIQNHVSSDEGSVESTSQILFRKSSSRRGPRPVVSKFDSRESKPELQLTIVMTRNSSAFATLPLSKAPVNV